jgi:hypothetical protein
MSASLALIEENESEDSNVSPPPLTDTDTSSDSDDEQDTDSVSESKDPGTDAESELVLHRRAGRPRAPSGSAADTARNAQRRKRAREKLAEAKLEEDWRAAVAGRDDLQAEILQQQLLPTVRGRTLFPSQTKTLSELKATKQLLRTSRS